MTVKELQAELKQRGLNTKGKKQELISRLLSPSQGEENSHSKTSQSTLVRCKCGVRVNDGNPMFQCVKCGTWSHISCYDLSEDIVAKAPLRCKGCDSSVHPQSPKFNLNWPDMSSNSMHSSWQSPLGVSGTLGNSPRSLSPVGQFLPNSDTLTLSDHPIPTPSEGMISLTPGGPPSDGISLCVPSSIVDANTTHIADANTTHTPMVTSSVQSRVVPISSPSLTCGTDFLGVPSPQPPRHLLPISHQRSIRVV